MSTHLGNIGETVAKLHFLKCGYEVFTGDDGTYFDFIAYHLETGQLSKVEVKTTRRYEDNRNGYVVDIRKHYGTAEERAFDKSKVDLVAVYIEPLNKLLIYQANEIESKTTLFFTQEYIENNSVI